MKTGDFENYKGVIKDLGYGAAIGETIRDTITYGEAANELKYYIGMADESGEPLNVEVFGDGFDAPIPSVRKAYFKAKRLLKKFSAASVDLRMK